MAPGRNKIAQKRPTGFAPMETKHNGLTVEGRSLGRIVVVSLAQAQTFMNNLWPVGAVRDAPVFHNWNRADCGDGWLHDENRPRPPAR